MVLALRPHWFEGTRFLDPSAPPIRGIIALRRATGPPGPVPSIRDPAHAGVTPRDDSAQPSPLWWIRSLPGRGRGLAPDATTRPLRQPSGGASSAGIGGTAAGAGDAESGAVNCDPMPDSDKQAILDSVVKLIQTAALKPGGDNFAIATQNLNQYFCGVSYREVRPGSREPRAAARADARGRGPGSRGPHVPHARCPAPRRLHALSQRRDAGRGGWRRPVAGPAGVPLDHRADPARAPRRAGGTGAGAGGSPALRRTDARDGDRGRRGLGRAGLAVHRPLPPARRRCLPADLHAAGGEGPRGLDLRCPDRRQALPLRHAARPRDSRDPAVSGWPRSTTPWPIPMCSRGSTCPGSRPI